MVTAALLCLLNFIPLVQAAVLPGNSWPNSSFELDANSNGIPDFWTKTGSDPTIDVWTTSTSVSATHSLALIDNSASTYGEWLADYFTVGPSVDCLLRYNLKFTTTGTMRVTVNFYNSGDTLLSNVSYTFSGSQTTWQELTQQFTTPANTAKLRVTFTSGGSASVTGSVWLDDLSLAVVTPPTGLIPYVHAFPAVPNPLVIRDWQQTATDYHQTAFNAALTGQYLPLLYSYTVNTAGGFSGSAFGLPAYVGETPGPGQALTVLGAVLGGTLTGMNMAALNGIDRVKQCEVFYSVVNGHGLVLNDVGSQGGHSAWYDTYPSILFYQIGSRYPSRPTFESRMTAIAESWLTALPVLSNNWEHTAFNFATMATVDKPWDEPDMAVGIAWLEYMAYRRTGDARYLAAADTCMAQMNTRTLNPVYEVLGYFGPCLAARMNAELGRSYSIDKHLGWVFSSTSDARSGWGCVGARWGSYDAYGLMGSTTDRGGYAFSLNTYVGAGAVAPLCRYAPQYASDIGRWLLHVAANSNLYFTSTLPANMQSSEGWSQQTGITSISYEGVQNNGITTPYSVGDAIAFGFGGGNSDFNPYGAWGSGILAALFDTTNVPGILKVDCLATDDFPAASLPTYLFYNPYSTSQQVTLNLGASPLHLYDCVTGTYIATNVTGNNSLTLPADSSVVLVYCPASSPISQTGAKLAVGGAVIDYGKAESDRDGDALPDWWETRYFGNALIAAPAAPAVNGLSNLEAYSLGLDPTNPQSKFAANIDRQPVTNRPRVTWPTVGGKTYAVEYANTLGGAFTPILTITENSVVAGAASTRTFIDDYSLTTGAPSSGRRFYRIRLVLP